jgi:TRAP-type C4-dicarboxylate transport system permease small subunit
MQRALGFLRQLGVLFAGTFLVLMVALIFLGGVARSMHYPLNWTVDAATAFFAWACFLCGDIAWRNDSLMSFTVLTDRLPERARKFCTYACYAIIVVFLIYLIVAGIWLSWISRARSFQGIPSISYSWVTMSLPVGGTLLLITAISKIRGEIRTGPAVGTAADLRSAPTST